MKTFTRLLTTVFLLALAGTSCAQQPVETQRIDKDAVFKAEQQVQDAGRQLQQTEQRFEVGLVPARQVEMARVRLEQAARDLAELSGRHGGPFIIRDIKANRAVIGINIGGSLDDGNSDGVEVLGVTPDSPADNAGIKAGDILLKIDNTELAAESSAGSAEKLTVYLAGKEPGDTVNVEYIRGGKADTVAIETMAMQPAFTRMFNVPFPHNAPRNNFTTVPVPMGTPHGINFMAMVHPWEDMELVELSEGLGKYFGTDKGVLVVKAPKDGTLQLEDGDVILNIDGREPNDPVHALRILGSYDNDEEMELQIMRDKRRRTLEVKFPEKRKIMETIISPEDAAYTIRHSAPTAVWTAPGVPLHPVEPDHNPESVRIIKRLHQPGI